MRLNVHDYSGHPFQVQLSRELAARGHSVVHGFSTQYVTGHGRLTVAPDDPAQLRIEGVTGRAPMVKYSPLGRARFERAYAEAWQSRLEHDSFDVVIACNVPLFALARMRRHFARTRQPWVLWHQDLYSLGVNTEVARVLPRRFVGTTCARVEQVERAQVADATAVVAITEAMVEQYRSWGITRSGVHVVPNWAPLDDIVPGCRDNEWSRAHGLRPGAVRLMYAGTLGRKHNPLLLLQMLDAVRARGCDAELIVASEGVGADDLAAAAGGRPDVRLVGYQRAEHFSDMLASADAVVALLEPDAARFSVPSKVLSYLSAGRPVVALMPEGNPAARDVQMCGGFVGTPTAVGANDAAEWVCRSAARPGEFERIGLHARLLAERRFDIGRITDRFERILQDATMAVTSEPRLSGQPLVASGEASS